MTTALGDDQRKARTVTLRIPPGEEPRGSATLHIGVVRLDCAQRAERLSRLQYALPFIAPQ
ncbi:hypothetical protein K523DRAFT_319641 [Schizophyllum commune Tattone D]|nr:hypothetical protein K523DRAFT_319641 [Schizophyllum commune Tattone D]